VRSHCFETFRHRRIVDARHSVSAVDLHPDQALDALGNMVEHAGRQNDVMECLVELHAMDVRLGVRLVVQVFVQEQPGQLAAALRLPRLREELSVDLTMTASSALQGRVRSLADGVHRHQRFAC